MPIQVLDYQGTVLFESDVDFEVAEFLGIKETSMYTRLSSGKGSYSTGRGQNERTVRRTDYVPREKTSGRRGPVKTTYRYLALYIDPETEVYYDRPHETTLDEIAKACKRKEETITNRFNKGQSVVGLLPDPRSYGFKPCTYKRVKPELFSQLDAFLAEWVVTEHQTSKTSKAASNK